MGAPVAAMDADGDTVTYVLGGTDAASFDIDASTGQLKTKAGLDYEAKASYTVTVTVSDGRGGSESIDLTIIVTDVDEAPPVTPTPTPTPRPTPTRRRPGRAHATPTHGDTQADSDARPTRRHLPTATPRPTATPEPTEVMIESTPTPEPTEVMIEPTPTPTVAPEPTPTPPPTEEGGGFPVWAIVLIVLAVVGCGGRRSRCFPPLPWKTLGPDRTA